MADASLNGLHVLVVEDDPMIGLLVEDALLEEGCHLNGPHLSFAAGLRAAETEAVDVAILDTNLAGTISYPIGEVLQARGIPFVLTSGYDNGAAPSEHPDWSTCGKPFTTEALIRALASALSKYPKA